MKCIVAIMIFMAFSSYSFAGEVNGYYRKNGTYVQPYHRSNPDNTVTNNYSYQGNINPYNGKEGSDRYTHDRTSPYFNGTPDGNGRIGHDSNENTQPWWR